jgi:hypothetical protein
VPDYSSGLPRLLNQLSGTLPELFSAQRRVESKRKERQERTVPDGDQRLHVPAPKLEAQLEAERDRITRIEDKARGTVVGITIAVSVVGAGIGMFSKDEIFDSGRVLPILAAAVLLLGLGYFLASGWLALLAYAASPVHTPDLGDRPEAREGGRGSSSAVSGDDLTWRKTLLDCLELNRLLATAKTNRFSACERFFGTVWSAYFSSPFSQSRAPSCAEPRPRISPSRSTQRLRRSSSDAPCSSLRSASLSSLRLCSALIC